jgi:hypothetical protein
MSAGYPSALALLWPSKLTDAGILKSAKGPDPTFTDTPPVDANGVTPGGGPSFDLTIDTSNGWTRVRRIFMVEASADIVGTKEIGSGFSASSAGLSFSDGTNTATVATSWASGEVVTAVVQVTSDGWMRLWRVE